MPISLATARGLLVQSGQHAYALPLDSLLCIIAVNAAAVKVVEGRQVIALDQRLVPLVGLAQRLED